MEKHFLNEIWIRHKVDMVNAHLISPHLFGLSKGYVVTWSLGKVMRGCNMFLGSWIIHILAVWSQASYFPSLSLNALIYKWRRLDWMSFSFLSRSKILWFFLPHLVCLPFLCPYLNHKRGRQCQREWERESKKETLVSINQTSSSEDLILHVILIINIGIP